MNAEMTPSDFLTEYLLGKIAAEPEPLRVLLYRSLADDTDDVALSDDCRRRARDIEENLKNERQMLLNFRQRHQPRSENEGTGAAN